MNCQRFPDDDRGLAHQRYLDDKHASEQRVEDIAEQILGDSDLRERVWLGTDDRSEAIWEVLNQARREHGLDECQQEYLRELVDEEVSKEMV